MYQIDEIRNKIICGNVLDVLKQIPDESVDCIVTSPPYWGLRDYGEETNIIWGGDPNCEHDWEIERNGLNMSISKKSTLQGYTGENVKIRNKNGKIINGFCKKCGAWYGQLGLEPTLNMYIEHMLQITAELKRVLKKTGVMFWNHGSNYQDKDDTMQNYELVMRMRKEQDWILRNIIVWCIMEDMKVFVRRKNKYLHIPIKKVRKGDFVCTIDRENNFRWVRIKDKFDNGKKPVLKITTKSGREIVCSEEHQFPVKSAYYYGKYLKLRFKKAKNLTKKDFLWINYNLPTILPDGNKDDYNMGFIVGFFIAEGSYIKRKIGIYKGNVFSKSAQKRWGRLNKPKIVYDGVQFSCGKKDFKRGYLKYLKLFNVTIKNYSGNSLSVYSRDKELLNLISKFVKGEHCDKKHFSQAVWNKPLQFIKGIVDGFLAGDGSFDEKNNRWRVRIKPNQQLKEDLELACRLVGYEFRYEGISNTNYGTKAMGIVVRKEIKRNTFGFLYADQIEKIEKTGKKRVYDIEVEPIYTSYCGKGKSDKPTKERRRAKWNNLYFLANGAWTHNSKPNHMPSSVKDRFANAYEPVFMLVKNNNPVYYYNVKTGLMQSKKPKELKEGVDWDWKKEGKLKKVSYWKSLSYWFDLDAVRVPHKEFINKPNCKPKAINKGSHFDTGAFSKKGGFNAYREQKGIQYNPLGKNPGDVWTIPTQPFPEAHFATFPERLVEPMIKAGCPQWICKKCGKARERITRKEWDKPIKANRTGLKKDWHRVGASRMNEGKFPTGVKYYTIGWTDCGCNAGWKSGIVLDPFMGSGTTGLVAKKLGRDFIGIDLNPEYAKMAEKRINTIPKPLV